MSDKGEKGLPGVIGLPYYMKSAELRAYATILEAAANYVDKHCREVSCGEEMLRHEHYILLKQHMELEEKYDTLNKNYMALGDKYAELEIRFREARGVEQEM